MHRKTSKKVVQLRPKKKPLPVLPFIFFAVIGSCGFFIFRFFGVQTYTVKWGTIEDSFISDAVILKSETPITSPIDGKLTMLVQPGDRVRVGAPIFVVTTDAKQKELYEDEVSEIEEKLKTLEDKSDSALPLNLIDKSIENTTKKLQNAVAKGEFDKVKALKDELSRLTEERQKALYNTEKNVEALKDNLKELKDKLNEVEIVVYTPVAGIVSLNVDGLEELLAPEQAENLSLEELNRIKGAQDKGDVPTRVKANQNVVKIIDNFSWYLALEGKKGLDVGYYYYIDFDGIDERIKAKLISANEDSVAIFSINRDIQSLVNSRRVKVEVMLKTHTGYVVPINAIVSDGQKKGVYVLDRRKTKFKDIEIIAQNETDAIVEGLKLGDKIRLR